MVEYFNSLSFLFDALKLNDDIKNAIIIQKSWRGYIQRRKPQIVPSMYHTKYWRRNQKWYKNGKHNECELYQLKCIDNLFNMTKKKIIKQKTNERLNFENNSLINISNVFNSINPFSFTENFDYKIICDKTYYFIIKIYRWFWRSTNTKLERSLSFYYCTI